MSLLEQHPTSPPELKVINGYHSHQPHEEKDKIPPKNGTQPLSNGISKSPSKNGRVRGGTDLVQNGHPVHTKINGRKGSGKSGVSNENQMDLNGRKEISNKNGYEVGSSDQKNCEEPQNLTIEGNFWDLG